MPCNRRDTVTQRVDSLLFLLFNLRALVNLLAFSIPGDVDIGNIKVNVRDDVDTRNFRDLGE